MINEVCEKGYKNNPLTDIQIANNREKSRVRSRVTPPTVVFTAYSKKQKTTQNLINKKHIKN